MVDLDFFYSILPGLKGYIKENIVNFNWGT